MANRTSISLVEIIEFENYRIFIDHLLCCKCRNVQVVLKIDRFNKKKARVCNYSPEIQRTKICSICWIKLQVNKKKTFVKFIQHGGCDVTWRNMPGVTYCRYTESNTRSNVSSKKYSLCGQRDKPFDEAWSLLKTVDLVFSISACTTPLQPFYTLNFKTSYDKAKLKKKAKLRYNFRWDPIYSKLVFI